MDAEETKLITTFISSWGWQILAMVFFTSSLILFSIDRTGISGILFITLFLLFIGCEFKSLIRQGNVLEDINE